ncbi:ABC transporter ATP-binding protein [Aquihabitans daechungensis]|uniref:ABC transporter ATP-binding protein n=1 Tax=Aquihabitans daechungensis TaxID=1052257 RepID=UPI003B9FB255
MTATDPAVSPPRVAAAPSPALAAPRLAASHLELAYDDRTIVADLSLGIPTSQITVIVGPNACGKSTLLRALGRLLGPKQGSVLLDGDDIRGLPTREVAQKLGVLPQQPISPDGIAVTDLVARGRHPHQRWFRQWSEEDEVAVEQALAATKTAELADRSVDELSGGQRQRVWIAMALAQGTDLLLLDEPTTFLDLTHQIDVLDLLCDLNREQHRTIVCVLHDLNLACRYAHHLVAMRDGAVVAEGPPAEIVTQQLVQDVFELDARIITDPVSGTPMVVPIGRHHSSALAASEHEIPLPELDHPVG